MSRCLIVDDQEQNLYLLQVLLQGNGYEVERAAALEEILKYRGIQFDGEVVDACIRLFREKGYRLKTSI